MDHRYLFLLLLLLLSVSLGLPNHTTTSADWPQILGQNRNGRSSDTRLFATWPDDGPKELWEHNIGEGYAGVSIQNDIVVVFHRQGREEVVEALDLGDGAVKWKKSFATDYVPRVNPDSGPRCVPLINDGKVYVFGASGDLRCLKLSDGEQIWHRDLYDEYLADEGYFGAGSTPIIVSNRLLLNLGGRREAGIIALDPNNGETLWLSGSDQASYSSPTIATIGGKETAVFVTRLHAVGVDPTDGSEVFRFAFGARGPTVNAATPLVCDEGIFFSASYGVGSRLEVINADSTRTVWQNDDSMSSQYSTCVYRDGFLYGTHGREDVGRVSMRCIEAKTGDIVWSNDRFSVAHTILVGDDLLLLTVDGDLVLADADPSGYSERARFSLFDGGSRALPALSAGKLVARSNAVGRQAVVRCYEVGEPAESR